MTVQDLCDKLMDIGQVRLANIMQSASVIEDTDFPQALTPEWLAENVQTVFESINRKEANEAELIGELEINAFLAAFQKMYEGSRKTRINRWAGEYTRQNTILAEDGPLAEQLRHIGVKVDDEWLSEVVPMRNAI